MTDDLLRRSCLLLAKPRFPIPGPRAFGYPLGLVGALTARDDFAELPLEAMVEELPPSIPLVITAAPHRLQNVVQLVRTLPRTLPRMLAVFPQIRRDLPSCRDARALVNRRPVPSSVGLARWLRWRLNQATATEGEASGGTSGAPRPLSLTMLTLALAGTTRLDDRAHSSARSHRRWARTALHCRPSDLHRLAELAKLPRLARNVDQLAAHAGTTPTRLRQRVVSALGLGLKEFNGMAGWEPVLEAAVLNGLGEPGWGVRSGGGRAGRRAGGQDEGGA